MVKEISLAKVLSDTFNITISSNIGYYRSNQLELERDLGQKLVELDFNNETLKNVLTIMSVNCVEHVTVTRDSDT